MGIEDSVDIGWKLAAVIEGWGHASLLDSYEIERRPLHEHVMAEAVANHSILSNDFWQPGLEEDSENGFKLRAEVGAESKSPRFESFHFGNGAGVLLRELSNPRRRRHGVAAPEQSHLHPVHAAGVSSAARVASGWDFALRQIRTRIQLADR